jgi:hypothetical protein
MPVNHMHKESTPDTIWSHPGTILNVVVQYFANDQIPRVLHLNNLNFHFNVTKANCVKKACIYRKDKAPQILNLRKTRISMYQPELNDDCTVYILSL